MKRRDFLTTNSKSCSRSHFSKSPGAAIPNKSKRIALVGTGIRGTGFLGNVLSTITVILGEFVGFVI